MYVIAKKWINKWFLIFCVLIATISFFNVYADCFGVIKENKTIEKISKDLINGKIISGFGTFELNDRHLRKSIINHTQTPPDIIAIGSSRIESLSQDMLKTDYKFYNYGLFSGSLEDHLALLKIYYDKFKSYPKHIIFEIDPWIFNKNHEIKKYLSLYKEYIQMLDIIGAKNETKTHNIYKSYLKIFSIDYFITNLKFIKQKTHFHISNTTDIDESSISPDGSLTYVRDLREPDYEFVKKVSIIYGNGKINNLQNFNELNTDIFEKFIKFLMKNGTKFYFYLAPYNPISYDIFINKPEYKIVDEVEKYLINFAKENDIPLIGSYNPHKFSFTNSDFYDGMHPLKNVYETIFKNLKIE
ncbi:hypothetical protein KDE13_03935 [Campylobacter sp. faydin G-140]|uniref:hypothetical protein n=1 Tax=Campylobacter anatolicus TaxID=2829105 RepID=UPI001B91DFE3|nr:hypothetical protein [Campylobacter anatolicus]MBR8465511.1 hypothetical protein [Campylobacter anatolicus]